MQHRRRNIGDLFYRYPFEGISSALMIIGVITALFLLHVGGLLVGLSVGIGFFDEFRLYFLQLRSHTSNFGLYKTLMVIGTLFYFILGIPLFVVGAVLSYCLMTLFRWNRIK